MCTVYNISGKSSLECLIERISWKLCSRGLQIRLYLDGAESPSSTHSKSKQLPSARLRAIRATSTKAACISILNVAIC